MITKPFITKCTNSQRGPKKGENTRNPVLSRNTLKAIDPMTQKRLWYRNKVLDWSRRSPQHLAIDRVERGEDVFHFPQDAAETLMTFLRTEPPHLSLLLDTLFSLPPACPIDPPRMTRMHSFGAYRSHVPYRRNSFFPSWFPFTMLVGCT